MSEWFDTPDGFWERGWRLMTRGREVTLASLSEDGWPEARTVILRAAEPGSCEVHTDLGSSKVASLRSTPRAALHLWDAESALQLRLRSEVEIVTGEPARAAWDKVPEPSQTAYGKRPVPGTEISSALNYALTPGPENFAILRLNVVSVDMLHLGQDHRRVAFARADGWQGRWLSP